MKTRQRPLITFSTVIICLVMTISVIEAAPLSVYMIPGPTARKDGVLQFVVPEFERRNPGYQVEMVWGTTAPDKLKTLISGGLPPDVAYVRLEDFPDLVRAGTYEPLNRFLPNSSLRLDNIPEVAMDSFTFNGQIYGVPYDSLAFNVTTMYINKDMFINVGLNVPVVDYDNPHSGWTYDDLISYSKKLTIDKNGDGVPEQYGYLGGYGWSGNAFRLIWNWGGEVIEETAEGWRSRLNEPQAIKALEYIQDLRTVHRVVGGAFLNGTQAMRLGAFGFIANIEERQVNFDWTLAAVPRGAGGRWGLTHVNPLGIISTSPHKEAAFRFLELWLSDEVQAYLSDAGALPPQTFSVARRRSFMFTGTPPYDKSPFFFGRSRAMPVWAPRWAEIEAAVVEAVQSLQKGSVGSVANLALNLHERFGALLR